MFGIYSKDKHFRIFGFLTGIIIYDFDETSSQYIIDNNQDANETIITIEKEIDKYIDVIPFSNVQFDETSQYIYYPSPIGIKLIELETNKIVCILGKKETERFLYFFISREKSKKQQWNNRNRRSK